MCVEELRNYYTPFFLVSCREARLPLGDSAIILSISEEPMQDFRTVADEIATRKLAALLRQYRAAD